MARKWLLYNPANRPLNEKRARQYAEDIKMGKWELNGEAIKFYSDGTLADGQHRLRAVIIANMPIKSVVITGLSKDVKVQDRGKNRSTSDIMRLKGYSKDIASHKTVAIAKLHYLIQKNITNVSDGLVEEFIIKNKDVLSELSKTYKGSKASKNININSAPVRLACFYAVNSGECTYSQLNAFLKVLRTGIPESLDQSAALVCRNDMLSGVIVMRGVSYRKKAVFKVEKAIQDFVNKYPRQRTYKAWEEPVYSCHQNNKEA